MIKAENLVKGTKVYVIDKLHKAFSLTVEEIYETQFTKSLHIKFNNGWTVLISKNQTYVDIWDSYSHVIYFNKSEAIDYFKSQIKTIKTYISDLEQL